MLDERAQKLAEVAVDHSMNIGPDDCLLVQYDPEVSTEFAELIMEEANKRGADTLEQIMDLDELRELNSCGDVERLQTQAEKDCALANMCTGRVRIEAFSNPAYLEGVDPEKVALYQKLVKKPYMDIITGDGKTHPGKKWLVLAHPTESMAQEAGIPLEQYKDLVYSACLIDWRQAGENMKKVKSIFDKGKIVRLVVPGQTDLTFSIDGRGGEICAGTFNMPDGEVMYGPVEDSANGAIYFHYDYLFRGNRIEGIRLEYKDGKVVNATAKTNQKFLDSMLSLPGVDRIGEFGIGCNYGIQNFTNELLFDEKMGGTIHLALGESYAQPLNSGGGLNESEIHWDIVLELRRQAGQPGGQIYLDGDLVQQDGVWVFDR